jgi:Protein kinase domain
MEYAAGGSLYSILSRSEQKKRLSPRARLYVAEALGAALEYLHANNIFHRDVKPDNMCFWDGWDDNPKMVLIDFGIASRVAESLSGSVLTSCPGTIAYMAEEYLLRSSQFTEKSEVFAVGVVLVNLLIGDCSLTRFDHRTVEQDKMLSHLDTSAGPWLGGTERALSALACRCLMKEPGKRPTVSELLKTVKGLRALACTETLLGPHITSRIHSYNRQSRPSHAPNHLGKTRCALCGIDRVEGAFCKKNHLTCSSGSCLEEMVREQLGAKTFKCPFPRCTKLFQPIDFYGKLSADLYGDVLAATDRVQEKAESVGEMKESILKALREAENSIKEEMRRSATDIGARIAAVHDGSVELASLDKHIKSLLASADENSRQQERLEKELSRLHERRSQGDAHAEDRQKAIMERMEKLSLSHAGGVALMASGRLQCPRLCVLCPVRSHRGVRSRFTVASEYQLIFMCAYDKSPVGTSVKIKEPKKWLKKATPLIKYAVFSLRVLATVYGGVPLPSIPDCIVGNSMSERMDHLLKEMEILLEPDDIRRIEEWAYGISDQRRLVDAMSSREKEISEEAYGALVEEAYKPKNRGWMDEMDIGHKDGGIFAWVKKENLSAWKLAPS